MSPVGYATAELTCLWGVLQQPYKTTTPVHKQGGGSLGHISPQGLSRFKACLILFSRGLKQLECG